VQKVINFGFTTIPGRCTDFNLNSDQLDMSAAYIVMSILPYYSGSCGVLSGSVITDVQLANGSEARWRMAGGFSHRQNI
jgi:hypothetical protein